MKNHKEMFEALAAGETLTIVKGTPFGKWEAKLGKDGNLSYKDCVKLIAEVPLAAWKIKPKTIGINGFEVPEPVREKLALGTVYFTPDLSAVIARGSLTSSFSWADDTNDFIFLSRGIIHLTKEAAELHAKALLSFTSKEI